MQKRHNRHFQQNTNNSANQKDDKGLSKGNEIVQISKSERLKNKIQDVSELLLNAVERFAKNEDYRKYTRVKWDVIKLDENGKSHYNSETSDYDRKNVVEVVISPCIKIDELRKAGEILRLIANIVTMTEKNEETSDLSPELPSWFDMYGIDPDKI